jgi:hydrogenase expression/formation protein HypE
MPRGDVIELAHGSGCRATAELVADLFLPAFDDPALRALDDQASFDVEAGRMVMSTDGFVVSPVFFPGGDIGSLSVHGTVNDLAMAGARPRYLSAGFILEEGLAMSDLARIVDSMARAARAAGVRVITGDTKVVEAGKADRVFITTTGVGVAPVELRLSSDRARPGDQIVVSGTLGDHGMAILSSREGLGFATPILSDSAALHTLVAAMLEVAAAGLRCMRDPTRGGLGVALNEICDRSAVGMLLDEAALPLCPQVAAACELLGVDPLYLASEGKLIAICDREVAGSLVAAMRRHPLGMRAAIVGEVVADADHAVRMTTRLGGRRIVDWLFADELPRIC